MPNGFSYNKAPTRSLFFSLTARARGPGREAHMEMVAFIQTELEGKSVDAKGLIASFVVFPSLSHVLPHPMFLTEHPVKKCPSCIEGVGTLKSKYKTACPD